ncbi:MAG: SAM-dependent chlorinase/fluorinase [candidate division WOR-3 bacterium]|nr:MAG: SAM-dependent chlorinase/fluorinase [candidate division WOR-3 bacterium]
MQIITFISDFGSRDWFVAAVKGEILKITPAAKIVDITHDIMPYDVKGAAFILSAVYGNFPTGAIHLAVVDPGVGGDRRPVIVQSRGHYFVGPDNGIFSYVYGGDSEVYEIEVDMQPSATFHARDVFGPAAARLAGGRPIGELARPTSSLVCFRRPELKKIQGCLCGEIVYIDHFGNCITNLPNSADIGAIHVAGKTVALAGSYGTAQPGEVVCVKGSIGYYEIACNRGNAGTLLRARIGMGVKAS